MVSEPQAASPRPLFFSPAVIVLAVLLGCTAGWLFGPRWPLGRSSEWEITVNGAAWTLAAWGLPLVVLGLFGGLALYFAYDRFQRAVSRRAQRISTALAVVSLSLLALCWPWALLEPGGASNLINVTWSDVSNEYFGTAYQISDVRAFTRDYAQERQHPTTRTQAHIATHPPGATLFYYGARRIFESSPTLQNAFTALLEKLAGAPLPTVATEAMQMRIAAARGAGNGQMPAPLPNEAAPCALWCAFLLSLAMAAIVPAVYLLAASGTPSAAASGDATVAAPQAPRSAGALEARGLLAAALFALAPSAQLFAFTLDALIACGMAWALVCLAQRVGGGAAWWLALAGAVFGLTSFVSIGVLAGLVLASLALVLRHRRVPQAWLPDLLLVGGGFLAAWLLLMAALPLQPLAMLQHALAAHHFATLSYRNRWGWAWLNLVTIALFAGWALTVAIGWLLLDVTRPAARRLPQAINSQTPSEIIGGAALLTMLLLTLSGSVRGEVERLWLFLLPPLCALAASALMPARTEDDNALQGIKGWQFFLVAQALQTLLMAVALEPLSRPF